MNAEPKRQQKATVTLERPKTRKQIEAWILEGLGDTAIAKRLGVSRPTVWRFRKRHVATVAPMVAEVERQITDAAIASKVNRILDADADYYLLGQIIEERAADTRYEEPGYKTGLMAHTLKAIGGGENMSVVDEYKVDTSLVAERRALRREVAEALDHLPRAGITFNDNRTTVLIRQLIGYDPEALG